MATKLYSINDLKEEANTSSETQANLKQANSFLKDLNNVLGTIKEITGVDIFSKIKEARGGQEPPTNLAGKIETEALKYSSQAPKTLSINSKLAIEDLRKRIGSLDEKKTLGEWKEELNNLDDEVFSQLIENWIKGVTTIK